MKDICDGKVLNPECINVNTPGLQDVTIEETNNKGDNCDLYMMRFTTVM